MSYHGAVPGGHTFPRGAAGRLVSQLAADGVVVEVRDMTCPGEPALFPRLPTLWDFQGEAHAAVLASTGGCVRMPTGSGKTRTALAMAAALGRRTLVLVPNDNKLARQWVAAVRDTLGIGGPDVGQFFGGQGVHGRLLTVAIPAGITAAEARAGGYGTVVLDEAQFGAARTFYDIVDQHPARYRVAWSADERRRDGMGQVIRDLFGPVVVDVPRADLEERGFVAPVVVRVVRSDFTMFPPVAGFGTRPRRMPPVHRQREAMAGDQGRNDLVCALVREVVSDGLGPVVVFSHSRDHVEALAEAMGVGKMRGGQGADQREGDRVQAELEEGTRDVGVATYGRFGVGHDVGRLVTGVCATPLGSQAKQFFGQVRGRMARRGKVRGYLYYVWDPDMFPAMAKMIMLWNDCVAEVRDGRGAWRRATPHDLVP